MSDDRRVGSNPLEWVDPAAAPVARKTETAPITEPDEAEQTTAARLIGAADNVHPEDVMSEGKVKIKQEMETGKVIEHLKDLVASLEAGTLRVEDGDQSLVLGIPETLFFEMKVKSKKDKAKCSLELSWLDDGTLREKFKIIEG